MRNISKMSTLEQKFPLLAIENGCIISKDADITVAFEMELPELFTITSDEYEAMHSTWYKSIKVLPNYTIVHKQDWFIMERYESELQKEDISFLGRAYEKHFNERPFLNHSVYLFITKTNKQKMMQQYINLDFHPEVALPDLGLNSFTKKYIKNILARVTSYIEESTGVAPNYCNYMNTQTKNPFEIEHIITDHYEWFTSEYADQEDFRRWRNSIGALLLLHKSINASLNDSQYEYCSNEGNIYTESLGQLAYQNNPKFKKFIADNGLAFRAYDQFGKAEISERVALLVQLVQLVWNDEMFK